MILSPDDLDRIQKAASECDDKQRERRGLAPRRTRCHQCATILTLVAHIRLAARASDWWDYRAEREPSKHIDFRPLLDVGDMAETDQK